MTPVDPRTWTRLEPVLDRLLDAAPPEREAILAELRTTDAELHALLLPLIAAAERTDGFLDVPLEEFARPLLPRLAGEWAGAYRLIRTLGEGGMGIVYAAEQRDPRRIVALKVIRDGRFADDRAIRAFRREVELLARLKHPSIASIYEAGETAEGVHYFAMEYVDGLTLDAYLRARPDRVPRERAEVRRRLELFLAVADAIAYAHQNGVMHLDLKPQNIVVGGEPGSGAAPRPEATVKVLDFGLARFFEQGGDAREQLTRTTGFFGTLPYMSPEQAAGGWNAVDVRADVYGLGVILHELLTGLRPLALEDLPLHEALRVVREENPRRPGLVSPLLRGDLETILLKALAKDPAARYAGVPALADDLRRHLGDLPIYARPPGAWYQLRKMVRRNRAGFGLAAALAVTLVLGSIGTLVGMIRAQRHDARATEEAAVASQIAEFLENLFRISDPDVSRGDQVSARDLLDRGAAEIGRALGDQPPRVRARLLMTMGNAYRNLGLYEEAAPLLEKALAGHRDVLGPGHLDVARSEQALATLLRKQGRFADARTHYDSAYRIRRDALGSEHAAVAASLMTLANLESDLGEYETARGHYQEALAMAEKALGAGHADVALYLTNLGLVCWRLGDLESARSSLERALAIHERDDTGELAAADDHHVLGLVAHSSGDGPSAESHLARALRIREKILGPEHPDVAGARVSLGNLLLETGNLAGARLEFERALAIMEKRLGPDHPTVAATMDNLANVLTRLGETRDVEALRKRSLAILETALGPDHPELALSLGNLAAYYLNAGDSRRALPIYERALGICDRSLGRDHPTTLVCLRGVADAAERSGDLARERSARERLARAPGS